MGKVTIWHSMQLGNGVVQDVAQVEQPNRRPDLEADYLVPTAVGLTSGFILGCAATALLVWLAHAPLWPTIAMAVAMCAGLGWLWALQDFRQTLWRTESMTVVGAQQPAPSPAPPDPEPSIMLLNPYQGRAAQQRDQAAELRGEFVRFVMACAIDTSARRWEKRLGRDKYCAWRDLLIAGGYAHWRGRDPKQGWALTGSVQDAIRALQDRAPDAATAPSTMPQLTA